jgi:single-stranded-DNA-specific exonuclease
MKWFYNDNKTLEPALKNELKAKLNLPDYIIKVFANRGLDTFEKAREVLEIDSAPLNPPLLFEEMGRAIQRIARAVEKNEKILVYGDYDVDGVTSIVMLIKFFRENLKYGNIDYYIPHRQDEGYGMNMEAVKTIKESGVSMIITVDCGISAKDEVDFCARNGIDVIITDHHMPDELHMPAGAYAVINPKTSKNYPDKDLSGAGVAYKLISAIADEKKMDINGQFLEFVALGTVADIVPMSRENRMLARRGFLRIERTANIGLAALKKAARLQHDVKISTYHVGFILGPRINAAGRIEHARQAVELFLSNDPEEAEKIAGELNSINEERKRLTKAAEEEAIAMFEPGFDPEEDFVIALYNANWNAGIVGLVASKMLRRFNRPAFIMTKSEDGLVHGSARSLRSVNIFEALKHSGQYLERYGGHRLAAGIKLKEENIGNFRKDINEYLKKNKKPEEFEPALEIDSKIEENMTLKDIKVFDRLQPWGEGNPKPVFVMENVDVKDVRFLKSNTMKFYGRHNGRFYNFIVFGHSEEDSLKIKQGEVINVAFSPSVNVWNGEEGLSLEVEDVK